MKTRIFIIILISALIHLPFSTKNSYAHKDQSIIGSYKTPPINPIFVTALRSLAKYIGTEYIGYKLDGVFEYIENKIGFYAKNHLEKVWTTYNHFQQEGLSTHQNIYHNHYHNCEICSKIGDLISNDYFNEKIELINLKIESVNNTSQKRIENLENKLNTELRNINKRFISIEKNLENLENKVLKLEEFSLPQIIVLKDYEYSNHLLTIILGFSDITKISIKDNKVNKEPMILIINNRMLKIANEISLKSNIPINYYKGSGIYGFENYDILIFL